MKSGQDGAVDQHGELLPILSQSATKMNYEGLLNTPLPKFEGKYPGSPFWMNVAYFMLRRTYNSIFRTIEITGIEKIPTDRGTLCAAWHTNGLIDPFSIILSHPKYFVVGGRHDLVTRPLLGFWARKFATQPVVRKAELLRGGCTEEEAIAMNGRSLLNLATGISYGYGCALFPEGTSHSESHLIRTKTGPMRTVLAAAAHAKANGKEIPVIMPIGLHFRKRHLFRTDCWIEYSDPIEVPAENLPNELVDAVAKEKWKEPPVDDVNALREAVTERLTNLTPNRKNWSEYYRDQLISHIRNRKKGLGTLTWREEVLATRAMTNQKINSKTSELAEKIAVELDSNKLNGQDLNSKGNGIRMTTPFAMATNSIKIALFLLVLPTLIYGTGLQIALGRVLGDNTDEGEDARVSYQFLTAMFGSMFFWPILSVILIIILTFEPNGILPSLIETHIGTTLLATMAGALITWVLFVLLFYISAKTYSITWDAVDDFFRFFRRIKLKRKIDIKLQELYELLD
ncbi:MAG: 1-acyl-sn-glycerol-3-phosphate acyltransferase [Candidatus Poseidoniaceae archaeon]|jgi:1-acyl-sn-glycerol-3-phosphate acyltransferase|nr:1-acyl-sn-glycerol-3-phosphate acyltransferase [Candidatus Poseidoniaceae archaeon]